MSDSIAQKYYGTPDLFSSKICQTKGIMMQNKPFNREYKSTIAEHCRLFFMSIIRHTWWDSIFSKKIKTIFFTVFTANKKCILISIEFFSSYSPQIKQTLARNRCNEMYTLVYEYS